MAILLTTIAAWTCLGTLLVSGLAHALKPQHLVRALRTQDTWPERVCPAVAAVLIIFELGVGAAGLTLAGVTSPGVWPVQLVLLLAAGLYALYAVYGIFLFRHRPSAQCGCSLGDDSVNAWIPLRAGVLATAAALASPFASDRMVLQSASVNDLLLASVMSLGFGAILWSFPASMEDTAQADLVHETALRIE